MKLVVCSTFTAEPLNDALSYLSKQVGYSLDLEFAPYNQSLQQLLDASSLVSRNTEGVNLFLVRMEDWCSDNSVAGVHAKIMEFVSIISQSASTSNGQYIVQFCPYSIDVIDGLEATAMQFESELVAISAKITNIYVLSINELNKYYPVQDTHNAYSDLEGHIPYTPAAYVALASLAFRKAHAISRPEYKVIVLDCDNTLWRGVCGELGAEGVAITPAFKKLQQIMLSQKNSGKLLCLCSKNNEDDVLSVFSEHMDMVLTMEDIVSTRINWLAKSENIKSLSEELNLGLESFIFIDDDPVQCAEVRSLCPQVQTVQLPTLESEIDIFVDHLWFLDAGKSRAVAIDRTIFYKQDQQRKQAKDSVFSLVDFIDSLEMDIQFLPLTDEYCSRAAELTMRTNQFFCGGKRYRESELSEQLQRNQMMGFFIKVSDRFGDYGLVGLCLFSQNNSCLNVHSFLLSCRAMGRGIEHGMVSYLGSLAQKYGLAKINLEFQKTTKNEPACNFFKSLGMTENSKCLVLSSPGAEAVSYKSLSELSKTSVKETLRNTDIVNQEASIDYQYIANNLSIVTDMLEKMSEASFSENSSVEFVPAVDDVEKKLADIWRNILKLDRVGVTDDFFEIGGSSLLAVSLVAEIYAFWNVKIRIIDLFDVPTIRGISGLVRASLDLRDGSEAVSVGTITSNRVVIDEVDAYEL
jgi:FkbH-like protein